MTVLRELPSTTLRQMLEQDHSDIHRLAESEDRTGAVKLTQRSKEIRAILEKRGHWSGINCSLCRGTSQTPHQKGINPRRKKQGLLANKKTDTLRQILYRRHVSLHHWAMYETIDAVIGDLWKEAHKEATEIRQELKNRDQPTKLKCKFCDGSKELERFQNQG